MTLNLELNEINVILLALSKQPLELVLETFSAVKQQAEAQVNTKVEG